MSLRNLLLRSVKKNVLPASAPTVRHISYGNREKTGDSGDRRLGKHVAAVLFGSMLVGTAVKEKFQSKPNTDIKPKPEPQPTSHKKDDKESFEAGDKKPGLPTYRAEEVSKHDNKKSFWVTYRHGVYDVTKFLPSHPGGEQIYNAAGLSIEPFWNVYGMHKTKEVYQLLETYRIGNLHDDDVVDHSDEELWVKEPYRDKRLIVKTAKPFNAEIPPQYQVEHFDTPNELFYVRQHMPVPQLSNDSHTLRVIIKGTNTKEHSFSLRDLDSFPRYTLRAALMCAGNRRSEMNEVKPVKGISWTTGAISNAVWTGVLLVDVLNHCGVDLRNTQGKHIIFTGADMDATGMNFSTSIPLSHAADPAARVLLATHMNGEPLPPDHGRPLRVIVPGAPAVRSVKWLESITIGEDESPSHWHQKDYRSFNPSKTWETADFSTAPPVYSLPVTSAICDPQNGDTVKVVNGSIQLRGYAYSGGGAKILRVDISADQGRTWIEATPVAVDDAPPREHYAWTLWTASIPVQKKQKEYLRRASWFALGLWTASIPVQKKQKEVEFWVKATDSNFNTQPEKFEDIWNIRGILSNAYHRIKVKLKH